MVAFTTMRAGSLNFPARIYFLSAEISTVQLALHHRSMIYFDYRQLLK
jgi:hypothetical protein